MRSWCLRCVPKKQGEDVVVDTNIVESAMSGRQINIETCLSDPKRSIRFCGKIENLGLEWDIWPTTACSCILVDASFGRTPFKVFARCSPF